MYGVMPYNIVMATMTRTARIDMRLTEEEKRLIEQASACLLYTSDAADE